MIGNLFLQFALWIITLVIDIIHFANLPTEAGTVLQTAIATIMQGFAILNAYFDLTYIFTLVGFVILFDTVQFAYDLFFFIVRKIPFVNIRK